MTKIKRESATRHDYSLQSALAEEVEVISYPYFVREYDAEGNLLKDITYNETGEIQEHFTYRYDENGRRIEACSFFDAEEIAETTRYRYTDEGEPLEADRVYADGSEDSVHYQYDAAGRKTGRWIVNEDGEEEERETWRYDEQGKEVWYEKVEWGEPVFTEEQQYDENGRVSQVILWDGSTDHTVLNHLFYDDDGQRNRIEKYNEAGKLLSVIEIPGFEQGQPSAIVESGPEGYKRTLMTYDAEGKVVLQQEYNQEEQLINEITRTYNEMGLITSTEVTNDRQGQGMNQHYRIEYGYEFF